MALLMRTSRIELLYTMRNFFNIKRWNTEPDYQQTIITTIDGITYSLELESDLWIFPFQQSDINYNTDLTEELLILWSYRSNGSLEVSAFLSNFTSLVNQNSLFART